MQLVLIIIFQIVAFLFLVMGIIPFGKDKDAGTLPLANKLIFLTISAILFFSLAMLGGAYEVQHCYIGTEIVDGNETLNEGVCDFEVVDNQVLSYINQGFGWISSLLVVIVMVLALASKNDPFYGSDDEE